MLESLIFFDIILHPGCRLAHGSKRDREWLLIKKRNKANFGSSLCQRGFHVKDSVIDVTGRVIEEDLKGLFLMFKVGSTTNGDRIEMIVEN